MHQLKAQHRRVEGLRLASLHQGTPYFVQGRRPRGAKGLGLTYEKKIGSLLKRVWRNTVSHQWFNYIDANGPGWCQTDHYIILPDQILLVECKLTETWVGFAQIDELYRPVLEMIYQRPVTGIMACKHLSTRDNPRLLHDFGPALRNPGENFLWHCLA